MADTTLEELQKSLQKIVDSIRAKKNEQQTYLDKANEVQEVYNRLLQDKRTMKEYRNEIKSFYGTSYTDFVGDNYKNKYKPKVKDLLNSYDQVIRLIDRNLDQLNNDWDGEVDDCIAYGFNTKMFDSLVYHLNFQLYD